MNADKVKSQMRKGMLEFCVLLLISRGETYASEIISRLKEARMIVVEGTLYPLLTRLKNDDLLAYRWEESNSGPPRKYYNITDKGAEYLTMLREGWQEITSTISLIERINPHTPQQTK